MFGSSLMATKHRRVDTIRSASDPLVSIILPCFNAINSIAKALKSIEKQTYNNWELIVVDDGSEDKTIEKLLELQNQNSKIIIHSNKTNSGVAYARNVGMQYAKGDYITFHDADDTSHPDRLEYQLYYLLSKKYRVVVPKYVRVNHEDVAYIINGKKKWNRVSGMMFSKAIINDIGYFKDTHISEDSEYHERILAVYGKKSRKIINKVLYYALFSPDSLLFSNADVEIKGNRINYKIKDKEAAVLAKYREEHELIKHGSLSPYESFEVNKKITSLVSK